MVRRNIPVQLQANHEPGSHPKTLPNFGVRTRENVVKDVQCEEKEGIFGELVDVTGNMLFDLLAALFPKLSAGGTRIYEEASNRAYGGCLSWRESIFLKDQLC